MFHYLWSCRPSAVIFTLNVKQVGPRDPLSVVSWRSFRELDMDIVRASFEKCVTMPLQWAVKHLNPSVDDLVGFYNWSMKEVLELHAPLRTRFVKGRRRPKWLSSEIILSRRTMRRAEKLWRMTKAFQDQETYKRLKHIHKKMIKVALCKFYQSEFSNYDGNSRKLWRVLNDVTGRFTVPILPTQRTGESIAYKFNSFLIEKTDKIRKVMDINSSNLQTVSAGSDSNTE